MMNRNTVKGAALTRVGEDTLDFPFSQLSYLGKTIDFYEVTPYSIYSKCPAGDDSWVTHFAYNGQEENRCGIANVFKTRFKDLKAGEAVHGNVLSGTHIKYAENGDMEIIVTNNQTITISGNAVINVSGDVTLNVTGDVTITSPEVIINGDLTVNGDIDTPSGDVTASGISLNSHTHGGVETGTGSTGGPQ